MFGAYAYVLPMRADKSADRAGPPCRSDPGMLPPLVADFRQGGNGAAGQRWMGGQNQRQFRWKLKRSVRDCSMKNEQIGAERVTWWRWTNDGFGMPGGAGESDRVRSGGLQGWSGDSGAWYV